MPEVNAIRVWFTGPTSVTDEHGTRTVGDFEDRLPDSRGSHMFHPTRGPDPWTVVSLASLQEAESVSHAWVPRDGQWVDAMIESRCDTRVRAAIIEDRGKIVRDRAASQEPAPWPVQDTWFEMIRAHGEDAARALVVAKLRAFAAAIEAKSYPDIFGVAMERPGASPCSEDFIEGVTVVLSMPWPG